MTATRHRPALPLLAAALVTALTAAFAPPGTSQSAVDAGPSPAAPPVQPPLLPRAVASFGAAVQGGYLYVYGGHIGRAHDHSRGNHVGSLWRLNLRDQRSWEQLPDGLSLQGTALVAAPDGGLIAVGGMRADNIKVGDEDLHSVASVRHFAPSGRQWNELAPLPEPRSSHDAVVVAGTLYVAGGWELRGAGEEPVWLNSCWSLDLTAASPVWQPLPQLPANRRACQLARFGDTVALVGGMDEDAEFRSEVLVLDRGAGAWRAATPFPAMPFGAAAVGVGDMLYASGMDGRLFRLADADGAWQPISTLAFPRFFHRLVPHPDGEYLLALGGAGQRSHTRLVEYLPLQKEQVPPVQEWTVPVPSPVAVRAGVVLQGDRLFVIGGNRPGPQDRFASERLVSATAAIDLAEMWAEPMADMPGARQSMATVAVGDRKDRILAVGGMGPGTAAPGFIQAAADIQAFDPRENLWTRVGELPTPRTAARCLEHGGELWLFGGMDFRPEADDPDGAGMPLEILRAPIHGGTPNFRASGAGLPGPRRSFGAVVWKDRAVLLGGIHDGFQTLRQADTFEFATKEWRSLPVPPRAWVAAEMGVIGERFYVACGGTMTGRRFHEDRSLVSYSEDAGWQTLIADLGFSTRSVQMRVLRDRLWFVDTRAPGAVTIRVVRPRDVAVTAQVQPFH